MFARLFSVLWVTLYFAVAGPFVASIVVSGSMVVPLWLDGTTVVAPSFDDQWPVFSTVFLFVSMAVYGVAAGLIPAGLAGVLYAVVFYRGSSVTGSIFTRAVVAGALGGLVGVLFSHAFRSVVGFPLAGVVAGIFCSLAVRVPGQVTRIDAK
jgi:hypothetical protein